MSIPHSVNGKAYDRFGIHMIEAEEGRALISSINEIDNDLKKLDGFDELHVGTFNSVPFKPPIGTEDVRAFCRQFLSNRRLELVAKFNARFAER
jgi:hypothetical protein